MRLDPSHDPEHLLNLEFFYWNKICLALGNSCVRDSGRAAGYAAGDRRVGGGRFCSSPSQLCFAYITLTNLLNVYAKGGVIPPMLASFAPIFVGCLAAVVIMYRRNF